MLDLSLILISEEQYEKTDKLLHSARIMATEAMDTLSLSGVYNNQGLLAFYLNNFDESVESYQKSLQLYRQLGDSAMVGIVLKNLGISLKEKGYLQSAINYYQQALTISENQNQRSEQASTNNSIGNLFNELKRFDRSYSYFLKAEAIWSELEDSLRQSYALGNLGISLLGQGRTQEAIEKHEEALIIKREVAKGSSIAITLNNLGEAHMKLGQLEIAKEYLTQSLSLREEIGETKSVALVCNNLANVEIMANNLHRAAYWLSRAEKIANESEFADITLENLRLKKLLQSRLGNYKLAYELDVTYDELKETAFNNQVVEVQKLQYEYSLEQEETAKIAAQNQLALSEAQRETEEVKAQIQTYVIIIVLLGLALVGYFAYNLRKKNRHIENLIRELHHRVKNHLAMISGMFGAQSEGLSASDTALLDEAKTRVEAVNGIHRRLYRQDEYEFVNMHEYLEELVDNNALVFGLFNRIDKQLDIQQQVLEIDKAISVGLIANEVLTNAFKYGLQKTHEPVLKIVLEKFMKGYRMIIFNNAEKDESTSKETGFGAELISRLTQNLKGSMNISQENGFQFELTFP